MTREDAARILDPETTRDELWKYEADTRIEACNEACRMGTDALRAQQERENPMTNGDRIRAMSDEELAKMMTYGAGEFDCYECRRTEDEPCDMNCEERCLEWLKKPVEEG